MKYHVCIILLLLLIASACRSNRSLDKVSQTLSETKIDVSVQERDSTISQSHRKDSISSVTSEQRYVRTVQLRPDGTIRSVQEEWRGTRRDELAVSHSGSSDVSVNEKKADSLSISNIQASEALHQITKVDNRLIQGSEWFYICLVIALVLAVVVIKNRDRIIKLFK